MKKVLIFLFFFFSVSFAQSLVKEKMIGPGVKYQIYMDSEKPLYLTVIEADLANPKIKIGVGLANDKIGSGGEGTSKFAERRLDQGEYILGAVNGDFFGGEPWQAENSSVSNSEVLKGISHRNRSLFGVDGEGKPFSGVIKYTGFLYSGEDTLFLNSFNRNSEPEVGLFNHLCTPVTKVDSGFTGYSLTETGEGVFDVSQVLNSGEGVNLSEENYLLRVPADTKMPFQTGTSLTLKHSFNDDLENLETLIGGLPYLIREGDIPLTYIGIEGLSSKGFVGVNPRTAVGFNKERNKVYIVAADGRNVNISVGMPLLDLAKFMKDLGCYEAVNLDGGGSTTMTVRDEIVNHPSDATGERAVHNFLFVMLDADQEEYLSEFRFKSDTLHVKKGELFSPEVVLFDKWGFELSDKTVRVNFETSDYLNVTEKGYKVDAEGDFPLPAYSGSLRDTLIISVKGEKILD